MSQNNYNAFLFIFFVLTLISNSICQEKTYFPKCGVYDDKVAPKVLEGIPLNKNDPSYKRNLDSDNFKDFKIHMDLENLDYEIEQNNLTHYRDIYVSSIMKAINTLEKLLKVVPFVNNYRILDESLKSIGLERWDKTKFGNESYEKNRTTMTSLGIDLVIFGKIIDVDNSTLASAGARYLDANHRPFVGIVNINKNVDYSLPKSREYLDSILIHEFTHILGFANFFFEDYFHNIYWEVDTYGVNRTYINSSKVLDVAKKYFDCDDIKGVALEEFGGEGTVGSHWEAKILLGDYMNGYIYTNEQVISEFTLALLEDSGFYKANYYTGGLMRYGKHKGCPFIKESCVNKEDHTINPFFENEFYDQIHSYSQIDPSCSSGRQSRSYYAWWVYPNLARDYPHYVYFKNSTYGGFGAADYCPVARSMRNEDKNAYYTGQCNKKGNGRYGTNIYYPDGNTYISESLVSITGETYSDHSFCFLSSLFKESIDNSDYYSSINRAICYDLYCSERSLTVHINDDYIVCPRAGGKIEVEGYKGFFLCPDYNLMCSGTVICNDMFECVDKKSLVKNSSYYYDYEIQTSQNLDNAYIIEADNTSNYELSENATCPIYCKRCKENQKCVKCRNGYALVGHSDSQKVECLDESIISTGYYMSGDNIHYSCIANCDTCSDGQTCEVCSTGYTYSNNRCIRETQNCNEYDENGLCKKCTNNFGFIKENRNECVNKENLVNYYSKDGGVSYYPCSENITDCQNCYYDDNNKNVNCYLCKENFILVNNDNNCHQKVNIDNDRTYFYINQTHAKKCSDEINNCDECESSEKCTKCVNDYFMVNSDEKNCRKRNEIESIDEYYLNNENTTYYSCNDPTYNLIGNCKKCLSRDTCYLCKDEYTFINGDKSVCVKKEEIEGKYILDPNDNSNYIKCSEFINNCDSCNSQQCTLCINNYIFINGNFSECISKDSIELGFYYTDDNITYYSCRDIRYQNNEKCRELLKTTIPEIPTTIPKLTPTTHIILPTTNPLTTQLNQVPTTQLNRISTTQLNQITTTQLNQIPTTQLNQVPTTQLNQIPTTQINQIPTTQLNQVQTTQINKVSTTHANQIPTTQINQIPTTQTTKIPTTQLNQIITTTQTNQIPTTQVNKIPTTQLNPIPITTSNPIATTTPNPIPTSKPNPIPTTTPNPIPTSKPNPIPTTTPKPIPTSKPNPIPTTSPKPIPITTPNPTTSPKPIPTSKPKPIPTTTPTPIPTNKPNPIPTTYPSKVVKSTYINVNLPTTIVRKNPPKVKEKVFFYLQVQIINGRIFIYLIINFSITKNTGFTFSLTMYLSRNLRNLDGNKITKEIKFYPKEDFDGNGDKIVSLISDEETTANRVVINELKNEENIEVKIANDNSDLFDSQKVEEIIKQGGVDFSKIEENGNDYTISQYKILSSSSGCEFSLNSEDKISQSNKNIILTFIEAETNDNMSVECTLSSENNKEINCNLNKNISSNYILKPYMYMDEKEIITIVQKSTNDYLQLQCQIAVSSSGDTRENRKKEGGLSAGAVVGIICGLIFVIVAVIFAIIICKRLKNKEKKNENTTFVHKFNDYPSTASNIKV